MHDTYLKRYQRTGKKRIIGMPPRMVKTRHKDNSSFFVYLEVSEFDKDGETFYSGKISRILRHPGGETQGSDQVYLGNYRVENIIADGLYGKVKIGTHLLTGQKVVLKVIERNKIDSERFREISLMKKLNHKHVVRMLEVIESRERLVIVYEFVDGGELYDYLADKHRLSEDEARLFWRQIVIAVKYMHSRNIAHRDLKLENVMLDSSNDIVVIDLGLGNFMKPDELLSTFCGSTAYAAPEMFLCQHYVGSCVDIWSMGVMLYCLVMGFLPFEDPQRVVMADFVPFSEAHEDNVFISSEFEDLITKIFQKDPTARISIDGIIHHPWTTKDLPPISDYELQGRDVVDAGTEESELLEKLKEFGFEQDVVLKSIQACEFNAITASFFLLRQKQKKAGTGGSCPVIHRANE